MQTGRRKERKEGQKPLLGQKCDARRRHTWKWEKRERRRKECGEMDGCEVEEAKGNGERRGAGEASGGG
jgi:hypothetical protein